MSKKRLSRRDFLRLSGAAGAAVAGFSPLGNIVRVGAQADKTINVLTVGDPWDLALQNVAEQFEEMTGIGVNIESLGYTALQARLVNAFLTQSADADVIAVDQMWISQYADNGWIRSLDDFVAADSDSGIDDFLPETLYSLSAWRNHIWTLPIASYAQGIMYRTDLFEAAGLDPLPSSVADADDWTWEDYLDILEQINGMDLDGTSMHGTTVIGAQPVPVVHMYSSFPPAMARAGLSSSPKLPGISRRPSTAMPTWPPSRTGIACMPCRRPNRSIICGSMPARAFRRGTSACSIIGRPTSIWSTTKAI